MAQREEQHSSVSTAPTQMYWCWRFGGLQAYAMKHQWLLALVTRVGQFHCVLYTTRLEVNLEQHCQDSMHSLDVIKRVPYVESLKSRAGIL